MNPILCVLLPPVVVFRTGRLGTTLLNVLLTAMGWLPGVIHAYAVAKDVATEAETQRRVDELRRANGREGMWGDRHLHIPRREPGHTVFALSLAVIFVATYLFHHQAYAWFTRARTWGEVSPLAGDQPAWPTTAVTTAPEELPVAEPKAPESRDDRTIAQILRDRMKWPTRLALRGPLTVQLYDGDRHVGEAALEAGQTVLALGLDDEGVLALELGGRQIGLGMDYTDLVDRARLASDRPPEQRDAPERDVNVRSDPAAITTRGIASREQRLANLKALFPPKYTTGVGTVIKDRPMAASNIRYDHNGRVTAVRTGHRTVGYEGRTDTIAIEVPHPDVWASYRGWVLTTTVEALPKTIAKLEQEMQQDVVKYSREAAQVSQRSHAVQANATINWIQQTFAQYLSRLKAVAQ